MWRLAVVVFLLNNFDIVLAYNSRVYCSEICGPKGRHIACHNNGSLSEECSSNAKIVPMNAKYKETILTTINEFRNKVARGILPGYMPASRMLTTAWSHELAKLAELSTKRCSKKPDYCRNTEQFEHVGQMVALIDEMGDDIEAEPSIARILKSWRNSYKQCDSDLIESYQLPSPDHDCSPFAQLVQARASHVSCALLKQTKDGYAYLFFICNFSRGNIGGRTVYKSGRSAKLCERGTNVNYAYLCSPLERLDINVL